MIKRLSSNGSFIVQFVAIQQSQHDQSLVYFNRAYHHVGQTEVA